MNSLAKLIVTIAVGAIGGITVKKLKYIPAAFMLGSLVFVMAFNLSTEYAFSDSYTNCGRFLFGIKNYKG